jgi:hypothetical protein
MIFRCERGVAQILVAVIPGEIEVGEPDIAVAAAGRDERDVPAVGRPDGRMIGCGVLGHWEDRLRTVIDRYNGDFKVVVYVRFKGKPFRVWRP